MLTRLAKTPKNAASSAPSTSAAKLAYSGRMHAKVLVFLLVVLGLLAACDESHPARDGLDGRQFLLDSVDGSAPLDGAVLRLSFEGDQLGAYAGCNGVSGTYAVRAGRLRLDEGLARTLLPCPDEAENWFADFLQSEPNLVLDGDELVLSADGVTLTFVDRKVADPDRPLAGTKWTVDSYIQGDAVSAGPMEPGRAATLEFDQDGGVHVDTTCNQGSGAYTIRADTITLSDVGYTEAGCEDGLAGIEAKVQAVMKRGTLQFKIEARRLTLMHANVGFSAVAD
jgi:heat shock protein HslJ